MIQFLKTRNRTMLELWTGIIACGILCQIVGAVLLGFVFEGSQLIYALSLWLGILMSLISTIHMYKSLDKALDFDEGTAKKKIYASYVFRYLILVVIFAVICITDVLNPLICFMGYMMLKVGALIQPQTHKIYNRIFHETDPIPMTQEEYDAMREAEEAESEKAEVMESESEESESEINESEKIESEESEIRDDTEVSPK